MSEGENITKQVAKLGECAANAAYLSDQLERFALVLEKLGASGAAQQVRTLDVPSMLTLPPAEGERLLTNLGEAVLRMKASLIASLAAPG